MWFLQSKSLEKIVTLESNPEHANVARENLKHDKRVEIIEGTILLIFCLQSIWNSLLIHWLRYVNINVLVSFNFDCYCFIL